ncbi:fused response regulator/phosphatase [Cognatishimia sp. SS12]|uniref:PP2C family protein-serine/threonine phosphatase n=1 Tax=Cognatishimia sp. SS12 TaxID=2979465 RepID=UPI00232DEDF8|nr:fused response regulator/phosphatase [Cognatishimia sp. SS12]MDC0737719.1 fused response regulator/phosphatase [Cognatishimia sp. SS12]
MKAQEISSETSTSTGVIELVLLVDNSRLQRRILRASLERDGYEVVEASSGPEALEFCRQRAPDLVLSAWRMPDMEGDAFCHALRDVLGAHYAYFILLTAKSEKEEVMRGLEVGADDFLVTPVNAQEMRARISAGERILRMQRELTEKNRVITETLSELQRIHDHLDRDLLAAKELQQSLVRDRSLRFAHSGVTMLLRPSGHVGGDMVGHYHIDEDRIGLFAIDVSGHGVSSALMTARVVSHLSSVIPGQNLALKEQADGSFAPLPPAEVLAKLNKLFVATGGTDHYFTMMLAQANIVTGHVILAQAGHPHPLIQRRSGQIEQEGPGGFPVGLIADAHYDQFELQLNAGDRLLILSDGVTEAEGEQGNLLGEEGLSSMAAQLSDQAGPEFLEALMWQLQEFRGGQKFSDDISAVLLEFHHP